MVVGAVLGIEPLSRRKVAGVAVAMAGVFAALFSGLSDAPAGAWRGEALMTTAVLCMAFYNVFSRPFIQRSSPLGFLALGMGAGAAALLLFGTITGRVAVLATFGIGGMDSGHRFGRRRGRACLCALGAGIAADNANARRHNDDGQSRLRRRCLATHLVGEPITAQFDRWARRSLRGHLDRDDRAARCDHLTGRIIPFAAVTTISSRTRGPRSPAPMPARAGRCSGLKARFQTASKAGLSFRSDK